MIQWRKVISFDFHHIPKLSIGFNDLCIQIRNITLHQAHLEEKKFVCVRKEKMQGNHKSASSKTTKAAQITGSLSVPHKRLHNPPLTLNEWLLTILNRRCVMHGVRCTVFVIFFNKTLSAISPHFSPSWRKQPFVYLDILDVGYTMAY